MQNYPLRSSTRDSNHQGPDPSNSAENNGSSLRQEVTPLDGSHVQVVDPSQCSQCDVLAHKP